MSPRRSYQKEADVKAEVKKILNAHGWYWWMPPANGFGKSNVDFNALRGGVFLAIETKFGKNKSTPLQLAFLSSIAAESGFGFVVRETTIDAFRTWMEAFDRSAARMMEAGGQVASEDGAAMLNAIAALTTELVFAKPQKIVAESKESDAVP